MLVSFAALGGTGAYAQQLEPRQYVNLPVGLNFAIVGYGHSTGGLVTAPTLPLQDAHMKVHTGALGYARTLDLFGVSGRVDAMVPWASVKGSAASNGQPVEREVDGFGDAQFRIAANVLGAPALTPAQFAAYRQDLVAGVSLAVSAPTGQYDASKLVNIGTNRWSFKPEIGASKRFGNLTVDAAVGVIFYTSNHQYFGGTTMRQDPVYVTQANASYDFGRGIWVAIGYTYFGGGRLIVDGVPSPTELGNERTGITLSLPIDRAQSIKVNASRGVYVRTGTDLSTWGIAYQYRWLDGS